MKTQSKAIRPPEGTVPLLIAAEKHGLSKKEAKEKLLAVSSSFVKVGHKFFVNSLGDSILSLAKEKANELVDDEPINEQALDVPQSEDVPQVLNATQRLFDGEETAIVKRCRLPNQKMMVVEYRGKEVLCHCKDSSMFIPGMKIIIRMDGMNLMSKYQPRKLGRY
jgi:hypothetical protein